MAGPSSSPGAEPADTSFPCRRSPRRCAHDGLRSTNCATWEPTRSRGASSSRRGRAHLLPGRGIRRSLRTARRRDQLRCGHRTRRGRCDGARARAALASRRLSSRSAVTPPLPCPSRRCCGVAARACGIRRDSRCRPPAFQRYARMRCCAFFEEGDNVVVTGAPLRQAIEDVDRSRAARDEREGRPLCRRSTRTRGCRGHDGLPRITEVNRAVRDLARVWADREQTGHSCTSRADVTTTSSSRRVRWQAGSTIVSVPLATWSNCGASGRRRMPCWRDHRRRARSARHPLGPRAPARSRRTIIRRRTRSPSRRRAAPMLRDEECTGDALARLLNEITAPADMARYGAGRLLACAPSCRRGDRRSRHGCAELSRDIARSGESSARGRCRGRWHERACHAARRDGCGRERQRLSGRPDLEELRGRQVTTFVGHDAGNVVGAEIVLWSPAVRFDNVELEAAREAGAELIPRARAFQ